jgi:mannose-6-phosphate isomerase-like protein (cupin superfamily)
MAGFSVDLEAKTLSNNNFREVLVTAPHLQLVVMTLRPSEDIGMEIHAHGDQFIRIESGEGEAILDGAHHALHDGSAVVIPAGCEHNIVNGSTSKVMRLYSIYAPPEHADGTIHADKAAAERAHHAMGKA